MTLALMQHPLNAEPAALPACDGLVLLAHGSRDPQWHAPIQRVLQTLHTRAPQALITSAYLEHSQPDLDTAVATLLARGARTLAVLPLFLGLGAHVRNDLPRLVSALQGRYPDTPIVLHPAVGEDPRLVQLLADLALHALDGAPSAAERL